MPEQTSITQNIFTGLICIIAFISAASSEGLDKWHLMSRHGECTEIAVLERKIPDLPDITDPIAFSELMKARGYSVNEQALEVPAAKAMQIDIAGLSLYLTFVTGPLCESYPEHE